MPNQPRTPARAVRVPNGLWSTAKEIAERRGETMTAVITRALQAYIRRHQ